MLNNETFGNKTYFICKKVKTVSTEKNPSYGPVVRLKRIGLNKEIISIYKLRTMYPYSEFIQKDLYDKFQLENSGKLKNDYRLTNWGRIFRRFFIDEIPQIYNWIRGDLKLIGVRALSEHYFNLYPKDLQELRVRSKPGLIPPFYVDLPRSFDELIESEKKYLLRYRAKPITTNFTYLFRAVFNIVFKGARSK
jgi:lipopolysaccharide/colanic/teichoic acid biosynthesis glycosyltransferase